MVAPVLKSFQAQVSQSNAHLTTLYFTWHNNTVAPHKIVPKKTPTTNSVQFWVKRCSKINSHCVKQMILRVHLIPLNINSVGVNSTP